MEKPELVIGGKEYHFVRKRNKVPVSVYKGADSYLRIGPADCISREVAFHKELSQFGFPIAEILEEGTFESLSYFIERSLGEKHFGQVFKSDILKNGNVQDPDFGELLDLVTKYATAQLKSASLQTFDKESFEKLIHYDLILEEKPELREKTMEAMRRIEERIIKLSMVLSHGDFNPHNILAGGVIDWERGRLAPAGYDLATCVSQIFFFPFDGDFEYTGGYRYSKEQVRNYWKEMDAMYAGAHFPKISGYANDFIFCRSIWSATRMDDLPKLQKWRYDQYEKLLDAYLKGDDLTEVLFNYSIA